MKSDNKGFTLIELIIAMTIILIVSLGFFGWASTIIQTNLSIERNNTAYAMLMDVAERLQRMSDNTLVQKRSGSTSKCVGYDSGGNLRGCNTVIGTPPTAICTSGTPQVPLSSDSTGLTILTNPWNGTTKTLYLYDRNNCQGKTWVDSTCGGAGNIDITADATLTGRIDHPNAAGSAYDSINPIRAYRNTTYYAVWSIAYLPCNTSSTDRRKIFVTVYWIDPEPTDTTTAAVQTKIQNGTATVKSVSIVVDKAIGTES
jgi:prepilin-type N-terminal cleavage/methylation domain-containing protein